MKQLHLSPILLACSLLLPAVVGCGGAAKPTATEPPTVPKREAALDELAWLTGSWARATEDSLSEEHWLPARGGVMLGMSHEVVQGRMVFFEYLRIEVQPKGVFYLASPRGRQPPTAFRMIECDKRRVVFENPTHDFPQRIVYWLAADDTLHARIEGVDKGRARSSEWAWQRVPATTFK